MNFTLTKEFIENIKLAIEAGKENELIDLVSELEAVDIAEILTELNIEQSKTIYNILDAHKASQALINLPDDIKDEHINSFSSKEIAEFFIENLDSDDAADIISILPEKQKEEVIRLLEDLEQASDIIDLLNYEEGTAGALMAKELIQVNHNWTVMTCVREMRRQAESIENIYTVYVVDDNNILLGILPIKKLLTTPLRTKIADVYRQDVKSVKTSTPDEEVAGIMEKYDLVVIPVVDELGRLAGRITIDDMVDVIKEEADKDFQLASGISSNIDTTDDLSKLVRARLPWLLVGLFGGILGASIISNYEPELSAFPAMAFFMPLIAAMGGNVGVQSSALVVQGLANKSMGLDGIFPKLLKELSLALLNGFTCSILLFAYNFFFAGSLSLSYTVSLALFCVIIFASLFGTIVPLILNRYKIDPALATGPFITTTNDILGLFIYFSIGRIIYGI
jgi:magnesium transporter